MFAQIYHNLILKNPKSIFIILLIVLLSFGYHSKEFRLDASSETLLIEGDPDLKYLEEISKRYGSKEFLILTYTPKESMVSDTSINNLLSLKYKIQSLDWVHSVITLLYIPLLNSSDAPYNQRYIVQHCGAGCCNVISYHGIVFHLGFKSLSSSSSS